jgi:hypothetical protein
LHDNLRKLTVDQWDEIFGWSYLGHDFVTFIIVHRLPLPRAVKFDDVSGKEIIMVYQSPDTDANVKGCNHRQASVIGMV